MYHSITFGDKNTWDDWHLVPSSPLFISPPKPVYATYEKPISNGVLDQTNLISKYIEGNEACENSTGSFEFYFFPGYKDPSIIYSDVLNYLHGRRMSIKLEDYPSRTYTGSFLVSEFKDGGQNPSSFSISYDLDP